MAKLSESWPMIETLLKLLIDIITICKARKIYKKSKMKIVSKKSEMLSAMLISSVKTSS